MQEHVRWRGAADQADR
ncbi:hypothetical protein [Stenotrophomonas sp. SORGH_AS_0282]|nr:hypothetical protein [Stenotrophomonas sp. SORGH_AS_0282]